jgi:hypothetical protein
MGSDISEGPVASIFFPENEYDRFLHNTGARYQITRHHITEVHNLDTLDRESFKFHLGYYRKIYRGYFLHYLNSTDNLLTAFHSSFFKFLAVR